MFGFFLDTINLGFLLREILLLYSSYLPLGVPNGTVIYINTAAISTRRRSSSGYRGVRVRPNGTFYAEIRSGDERIGLGTFETAHEAARAYDTVAWRLGRSRRSMNFDDVTTRQQAEMLAPPPPSVTREQRQRQRELELWLIIAERDERLRLEWAQQFPEDVAAMEAFYAEKAEEKAAVKAAKKADREERWAKSAARKKRGRRRSRGRRRGRRRRRKTAPARRRSSCRLPLPSTGHPLWCRRRLCRLVSGTLSMRSRVVFSLWRCSGVFSIYLQC
jgi:hypothetical protein